MIGSKFVALFGGSMTLSELNRILSGSPTSFTFAPTSTSQPLLESISADPVAWGVDNRPNMFQTTLTPSAGTSNIWENFNSFVTLGGSQTASGEINVFHGYFQCNSGATASQVEVFEASALNSGTIGSFQGVLSIFNNGASATVSTTVMGAKFQLTNQNTTAASIAQYVAINMEAMAGGGSTPTGYYFLRNADSNASSNTLGKVAIGNLGVQTPKFFIQGDDTSGSTSSFKITDSGTAALFQVFNDGAVRVEKGILNIGVGTNWGKAIFTNATSGSIQLSAPSSGALGSAVATLPTGTTTLLGSVAVNTVSPTSPNRTIQVVVGGTTYYIAAKTTND